MTHLTVALTAADPRQMIADLAAAAAEGATLAELRIDHLADPSAPLPPRPAGGLPIIVTCRPEWEGGRFRGSEADRRRILLSQAAALGAEWIDVEYNALLRSRWPEWESLRGRAILSFHDFAGVPADLPGVAARMAEFRPAKIKIAATPGDLRDALRILRLFEARPAGYGPGDLVALGMGEAGLLTRVLAGKPGACLTFASLSAGAESAPGQATLRQMRDLYRFAAITPATETFGVFGKPVGHSMSPLLHNTAFAEAGMDRVYLPLPVDPGGLAEAVASLRAMPALNFRGASVTIPHKEAVAALPDADIDDAVRAIGAGNTLWTDADGRLHAANTDWTAIRRAVAARVPAGTGRRALVLGAGGAARAAVAALQAEGFAVTVCNRSPDKAEALAREFRCAALPWEDRTRVGFPELLLNATSLGMHPHVADTPLPDGALSARTVVFDTVYNPLETRLLREARAKGCPVIDGLTMFVGQAVEQFRLWTGVEPSADRLAELVRRRLTGA